MVRRFCGGAIVAGIRSSFSEPGDIALCRDAIDFDLHHDD